MLAVLCKPIARIHYILGKYLGIILAATVLILSQGLVLEIALITNKYNKISSGLTDVFRPDRLCLFAGNLFFLVTGFNPYCNILSCFVTLS